MSRLGDRLKELRGQLSLFDIQKGTGISRIEISRYEQGKKVPMPPNLKKLCEFFEVPYESLRILYYEDFFANSEERVIVLKWAAQQLKESSKH